MAVTFTVLGKTGANSQGITKTRVKAVLDNAYPVAGYAITPANCGLSMFQVGADGKSFVDPVVTGVNGGGVLAEIIAQKLLLGYPTGGADTAPTTPAAPLAQGGASTASAVSAIRPGLTPGVGKAFPDAADAHLLTVFFDAYGYSS